MTKNTTSSGRRIWPLSGLAGLLLLSSSVVHAQGMTLNLKDADIEAVIATVSEATGKNFIVDPRVKGKVTIISSGKLDADSLYQIFLAVLGVHGFAAVPAEGAIKIIPAINARESAGLVVSADDPGSGDEYVTRVIAVENVPAADLVPILRPLLPQDGHLAAVIKSNVLIASGLAANINRLVEIMHRIDRRTDDDVEVLRLKQASATEVVRILKSLDQGGKGESPASLVADERTNSVLLSGSKSDRLKYRALVTHLDTPLESTGNVEVIFLNYANAKDLVQILNGVSQGIKEENTEGKSPQKKGNVFIEADESSNALVINAPADLMQSLKAVVRKLDYRRAQVHVEAVIAEVSTETANEFGIQWGATDSGNNSVGAIVNFGGSGSGITNIYSQIQSGTVPTVDGMTMALGDMTGSVNIAAVIRALAADAHNNILATPSLMTMDNQEAEISVGKEVPFVTGSYTSTGSDSNPTNPFQTYERKNVGLNLKVKPQVNEGDSIKLNIAQEVSSIASTTSGAADIVTNKRTLTTSVMVGDGQTIVLGGLIDELMQESEQSVPLLGDLPVLGAAFRYDNAKKTKTNLMIFIRPTIIRDSSQLASVAGSKYQYIRAQQLTPSKLADRIALPGAVPTLPQWNNGAPASPSSINDGEAPAATPQPTESKVETAVPPKPAPTFIDAKY